MPKERGAVTTSSSALKQGITKPFSFWQDREIRFDAPASALQLRGNAEQVLATFHHVEDTKGNSGQAGTLLVTNLRLLWWSDQRVSMNLSIGYFCMQQIRVQETESKLIGGMTESLTIEAKLGPSRFRFLFSVARGGGGGGGRSRGLEERGTSATTVTTTPAAVGQDSSGGDALAQQRLYSTIHAVWSAYESTRVYRELRVRTAVVQQGHLRLLPGESIISRTAGVNNVSKDEGHIGTFVVTNIRVVWFATAETLNVSVPYLQFVSLRTQRSRFGLALVIDTSPYAGNYVLGFRVDPEERLSAMYTEVSTLWRSWTARPLLGIQVELKNSNVEAGKSSPPGACHGTAKAAGDDAEGGGRASDGGGFVTRDLATTSGRTDRLTDGGDVFAAAGPTDAFAAYYADEGKSGTDRRPVYDASIGLAVEKPRRGTTIQSLWDTAVPTM